MNKYQQIICFLLLGSIEVYVYVFFVLFFTVISNKLIFCNKYIEEREKEREREREYNFDM